MEKAATEKLDDVALNILGVDPSKPQTEKNLLCEELTVRLTNWIVNGFDKLKKRDAYFVEKQQMAPAALTAIRLVFSALLFKKDVDREFLLGKLLDAGKIIAMLHHGQLNGRKAYILPIIKSNLRPIFESMKSYDFIFGKDLAVNIKQSLNDEKSCALIKGKKHN
ncbi:hypothetical protein TKK_0017338 [Trichogramma kaykai]